MQDNIPAELPAPDPNALTSPAADAVATEAVAAPSQGLPLWHKCLQCPELGRTCNGYDLTALDGVESARAYHKALRIARGFTVPRVHAVIKDRIGWGTAHDYFGRGGIDPKWLTVASIDFALVALCGDRVDLPPLETPCPATFGGLRERCDALSARLGEASEENARLAQALATAEANAQTRLTNQRADLDKIIELQQARIAALEAEKKDYLDRNDRKRAELEAAREEIRELNKTIIQITGDFATKTASLVDRILAITAK